MLLNVTESVTEDFKTEVKNTRKAAYCDKSVFQKLVLIVWYVVIQRILKISLNQSENLAYLCEVYVNYLRKHMIE